MFRNNIFHCYCMKNSFAFKNFYSFFIIIFAEQKLLFIFLSNVTFTTFGRHERAHSILISALCSPSHTPFTFGSKDKTFPNGNLIHFSFHVQKLLNVTHVSLTQNVYVMNPSNEVRTIFFLF